MQQVMKSHSLDLRADPAWIINSGKIKSSPGDFPGSRLVVPKLVRAVTQIKVLSMFYYPQYFAS